MQILGAHRSGTIRQHQRQYPPKRDSSETADQRRDDVLARKRPVLVALEPRPPDEGRKHPTLEQFISGHEEDESGERRSVLGELVDVGHDRKIEWIQVDSRPHSFAICRSQSDSTATGAPSSLCRALHPHATHAGAPMHGGNEDCVRWSTSRLDDVGALPGADAKGPASRCPEQLTIGGHPLELLPKTAVQRHRRCIADQLAREAHVRPCVANVAGLRAAEPESRGSMPATLPRARIA